jgi:hypothetical protein
MHERVSGLRNSGLYFFRGDFEHVLRDIVFEYVPRGGYITDFRFPLFDLGGPNLLYSDRLASCMAACNVTHEYGLECVMNSENWPMHC